MKGQADHWKYQASKQQPPNPPSRWDSKTTKRRLAEGWVVTAYSDRDCLLVPPSFAHLRSRVDA